LGASGTTIFYNFFLLSTSFFDAVEVLLTILVGISTVGFSASFYAGFLAGF